MRTDLFLYIMYFIFNEGYSLFIFHIIINRTNQFVCV